MTRFTVLPAIRNRTYTPRSPAAAKAAGRGQAENRPYAKIQYEKKVFPIAKQNPSRYCTETQFYKNIPVTLIVYTDAHFAALKAKRFMLGRSGNQNVWIPNKYLDPSGKILPGADLDWLFRRAYQENKFFYAGIGVNPYTWQQETPRPVSGRAANRTKEAASLG